jgi:hypothetical protein
MRFAVRPLRPSDAESASSRPATRRTLVQHAGARRAGVCFCRLLTALATGYVAVTGCDYANEYPIEATFCDDWCRVLRRSGCEQEPENCVRDCESALPSDRCLGLQSSLLDCYESIPADRFECVGQGFQSTVRPTPEICTEQRHDLIRCEVPRVMACVDACLTLDATDPAGPGSINEGSSRDAGVAAGVCPEPPFPCERLCWELDAQFGRGRPTTLTAVDTSDDTDLAAIGAPYIRCAQQRAAECRAAGGSDIAGDSASDSLATSWTGLFLECAGLPVDPDLLD